MFDTHAHLEMIEGDVAAAIDRAKKAGVKRILTVGSKAEANSFVLDTSRVFKDYVCGAIGFDRDQAGLNQTAEDVSALISDLRYAISHSDNIVAIGETGLDFHYRKETADQQIALFKAQLEFAREAALPVIVHSREAEQETLSCLEAHSSAWTAEKDRVGIIHCFTASRKFADRVLDMGFMISFSGILTFRNADDIRETARSIPENMILVETDSPYLAPEPLRGRKNEPAYLYHTLACLAEIRRCTVDHMAGITEENACRLLGIG